VAEAHNAERGPQARALRCVPRQAIGERIAREMLEATDPPGLAALWVCRGSFRND
jgi:hypothetical protein